MLTDDKSYPYIEYISSPYPMLKVSRYLNIKKKDNKKLFGPYPNAYAARRIVNLLNRLYPLKKCEGKPKDVCLYYHIGKCLAPCQGKVTPEEYQKLIKQVELFLSGKQSELLKQIQGQMQIYASEEQFEKAAKMRDSFLDLQKTLERQKVVYENTKLNEDIIAVLYEDGILAIVIMMIREGRLIDKKDFSYFVENINKDATKNLCLTLLKYPMVVEEAKILNKQILIHTSLN